MPITEQERQSRMRALQGARAINAIGGGPPPSNYTEQLYARWVNGELTIEEIVDTLTKHSKRIADETEGRSAYHDRLD